MRPSCATSRPCSRGKHVELGLPGGRWPRRWPRLPKATTSSICCNRCSVCVPTQASTSLDHDRKVDALMSKIMSGRSYRGGTGKSNLVANLACSIAQQGKRAAVVDTDLQSPGLHVLFGMDGQTTGLTLNDYLYGRCRIEQVAHDVTAKLGPAVALGGTLYLVPASIKLGEIQRVLREAYEVTLLTDGFRPLIKTLQLDYLFLDTHPALNEETLLSLLLSAILFLL